MDFATAKETVVDGARRAEIKKAEGIRQAKILEAEGETQAIALVNEAADRYFVGNAQLLISSRPIRVRVRILIRPPLGQSYQDGI